MRISRWWCYCTFGECKISVNFSPYDTIHHKVEETGYMDPDTEIENSNLDNKIIEAGSDICVSEGGEMFDLYNGKDSSLNEVQTNIMEPYVGMEFDSEDAAMAYYTAYSKHIGFLIRIGNCHRSSHNGSVISRRYLCNKEGFRVNRKGKRLEVRKPREATREGCKAMIMVRKEKSGKWIVARIETQHSHPLGIPPGKGRRGGSISTRSQDEKDKRIRELSAELNRTKQQLAECQKQLDTVLNDVELHVDGLSRSIKDIFQNMNKIENEGNYT